MFGSLAIDLIGESQAQQPAQGFLVLSRDMNWCEMAAAVEARKHDSVETIGLAAITGFTGDERRCNDFAVEAILGEDPLENEACAGRLVAGPNGSFLGKASKKTADLHKITGEPDDFRILNIAIEDSGSNRIGVHIETD
jgi:hypothetical protein